MFNYGIIALNSNRRTNVALAANWMLDGMNEANAVLISKAPELLELVTEMLKLLEAQIQGVSIGRETLLKNLINAESVLKQCKDGKQNSSL